MKNLLRSLLVLACALFSLQIAGAQSIPNAGFETWATRNGAEAPTNWQNSDDYLHALLVTQAGYSTYVPTGAVTKSTTAHSGSYAASLTTSPIALLNNTPFPGIAILGSKLGVNLIGGVPYATRPTQLQFYYRYNGPVSDSAAAIVFVTNTVNGEANPLGQAVSYLAPTSGTGYVQATVPVTYSPGSSAAPDSVRILFISGNARHITVGSQLLVDDVSLAGTATAVRADADVQAHLTISPNPSTGGRFVVASPNQPELAASPLLVLDNLGRTVAKQDTQATPGGQRELDLSFLSPGLYLLRLDTKAGSIVRQLSIK